MIFRPPRTIARSLLLTVVCGLFLLTSLSCASSPTTPTAAASEDTGGEAASSTSERARAVLSEVQVSDLLGAPHFLLGEAQGRVLIVDFWATWCQACKGVKRDLETVQKQYDPQHLAIAGVDVGESLDKVQRYLRQSPASYPVYLDPEFRLADALAIGELPQLYVFDAHGVLLKSSSRLTPEILALIDREVQKVRGAAPLGSDGFELSQ